MQLSVCNTSTHILPLRISNYGTVKPGYLRAEKFKQLLNDNEFVKGVEIANNGEAFLNPEMKEILEYAYEKQVDITVYNGTNFNFNSVMHCIHIDIAYLLLEIITLS